MKWIYPASTRTALFLRSSANPGKPSSNSSNRENNFGVYALVSFGLSMFFPLGLRLLNLGFFPISSLFESLTFVLAMLSGLLICLEQQRPVAVSNLVLFPFVIVLSIFVCFAFPGVASAPSIPIPAVRGPWLGGHVALLLANYVIVLFGSISGATRSASGKLLTTSLVPLYYR